MGRLPLVWGATHDRNHHRRADLAAQGPRPVRTCYRRSRRRERCRRTGGRGADGRYDAPSGTTRRPSRQAAGAAHRPHGEASRPAPVTPIVTRRRGSERKTCSALPARLSLLAMRSGPGTPVTGAPTDVGQSRGGGDGLVEPPAWSCERPHAGTNTRGARRHPPAGRTGGGCLQGDSRPLRIHGSTSDLGRQAGRDQPQDRLPRGALPSHHLLFDRDGRHAGHGFRAQDLDLRPDGSDPESAQARRQYQGHPGGDRCGALINLPTRTNLDEDEPWPIARRKSEGELMSFGSKEGAAGMLKNTGSELKERLGEARHRLIPGSAQPWAASANTPANASAVWLRSWLPASR